MSAKGLLIEGDSSIFNVDSWAATTWQANGVSRSHQANLPNPIQDDCYLMYATTLTSAKWWRELFSTSANGWYTTTLILKAAGYDWIQLVPHTGFDTTHWVNINLVTGAEGFSSGSLKYRTENLGDGWWKISFTAQATSTESSGNMIIGIYETDTNARLANWTGDDVSGVYCPYYQIEREEFPTSLQITGGATYNRAPTHPKQFFSSMPNLANSAITNDWCGQVVWYPHFSDADVNIANYTLIAFQSAGDVKEFDIFYDSANRHWEFYKRTNGLVLWQIANQTWDADSPLDIRWKMSSTDGQVMWINGVKGTNAATSSLANPIVSYTLGHGLGIQDCFGVFKTVRIFKGNLPDEQIEGWP